MSFVSKLVNFASILEDQTRAQAERTAALPIVWPHLALMQIGRASCRERV